MEKIIVYAERGWNGGRQGLFNEKTSIKLAEAWFKYETYSTYTPNIDQLWKTKTGKYITIERESIRPFFWWKEWKKGKIKQIYLTSKEEAIEFYNNPHPSYKKIIDCPELEHKIGLKEI